MPALVPPSLLAELQSLRAEDSDQTSKASHGNVILVAKIFSSISAFLLSILLVFLISIVPHVVDIIKKNFSNMEYSCCPPYQASPSTFQRCYRQLCFPLFFGLLYLQNSSLSKALFPHLLSIDAIQGDTNLSPCPLLFLGWLDLLLESTCSDKFNQQEFLKSHILLCSFRRNISLEALLKNTFGCREEVIGRRENLVKLKPSLLHYCRGINARGGTKTVCSPGPRNFTHYKRASGRSTVQ